MEKDEKLCCETKVYETEGGVRIEAKGKGVKECLKNFKEGKLGCCCCGPVGKG